MDGIMSHLMFGVPLPRDGRIRKLATQVRAQLTACEREWDGIRYVLQYMPSGNQVRSVLAREAREYGHLLRAAKRTGDATQVIQFVRVRGLLLSLANVTGNLGAYFNRKVRGELGIATVLVLLGGATLFGVLATNSDTKAA